MTFNWTCPYCNSKTTINDDSYKEYSHTMKIDNAEGGRELVTIWIVCPNEKCKRITMTCILFHYKWEEIGGTSQWRRKNKIKTWRLLPGSYAKVFPEYIPKQLRNDYEEASAIIDLSPKASLPCQEDAYKE